MAEQKKMVEAITSMEEDFAKWYTDIVKSPGADGLLGGGCALFRRCAVGHLK